MGSTLSRGERVGLDVGAFEFIVVAIEDWAEIRFFQGHRLGNRARRQRADGRRRTRRDAAHERERAPEGEPLPGLVRTGLRHDVAAVVENVLDEPAVLLAEPELGVLLQMPREGVPVGEVLQVEAPTLDEVIAEPLAKVLARLALKVAEVGEIGMDQAEQLEEGVSRCRCGGSP